MLPVAGSARGPSRRRLALQAVALAAALAVWLAAWSLISADPPRPVHYATLGGAPAELADRLIRTVRRAEPGGTTIIELRTEARSSARHHPDFTSALRILARAPGTIVVYVPRPVHALSAYDVGLLEAADVGVVAPTLVIPAPETSSVGHGIAALTARSLDDVLIELDGRRISEAGRQQTLRTADAKVEGQRGDTVRAGGTRPGPGWFVVVAAVAAAAGVLLASAFALPWGCALSLAVAAGALVAGAGMAVSASIAAAGAGMALALHLSDARLIGLVVASPLLLAGVALLGEARIDVLVAAVALALVGAPLALQATARVRSSGPRSDRRVSARTPRGVFDKLRPVHFVGAGHENRSRKVSGNGSRRAPETGSREEGDTRASSRDEGETGGPDTRENGSRRNPDHRPTGPKRPRITLEEPPARPEPERGNLWPATTVGLPSRVARLVPKLPVAEPGLHDTVVDYAAIGGHDIRAASVRGARHRQSCIPRQDDYALAATPDEEFVVTAVADGVSAAADSHVGAYWAVTHATRIVVNRLGSAADGIAGLDHVEIVTDLAAAVASSACDSLALADRAPARDKLGHEVAATVVIAVVAVSVSAGDARSAWFARVGDSAAHVLGPSGWRAVFPATKGSATAALPDSLDRIEQVTVELAPDDAILLMTDGIDKPLGGGRGEVGRFLAERWRRPPDPLAFMLDVQFERKTFDDDRTVVGIWPSAAVGANGR